MVLPPVRVWHGLPQGPLRPLRPRRRGLQAHHRGRLGAYPVRHLVARREFHSTRQAGVDRLFPHGPRPSHPQVHHLPGEEVGPVRAMPRGEVPHLLPPLVPPVPRTPRHLRASHGVRGLLQEALSPRRRPEAPTPPQGPRLLHQWQGRQWWPGTRQRDRRSGGAGGRRRRRTRRKGGRTW